MGAQVKNMSANTVSRFINRLCRTAGYRASLHPPPQLIHRVKLRGGFGQEPNLNIQPLGQVKAILGNMWRATILKKHNVPPSPM